MSYLYAFPPAIQFAAIVLLGLYVATTIAGRLSPRWQSIWRDPDLIHTTEHRVKYTVVPGILWAGLTVLVLIGWDLSDGWLGVWTLQETLRGPSLVLGGFLLAVLSPGGPGLASSDPRKLRSWLPLLMIMAAIVMLILGIFYLMDVYPEKKHLRQGKEVDLVDSSWMLRENAEGDTVIFRYSRRFLDAVTYAALALLIVCLLLGRASNELWRSWSLPLAFFTFFCGGMTSVTCHHGDIRVDGEKISQTLGFPWSPKLRVNRFKDFDTVQIWDRGGKTVWTLRRGDAMLCDRKVSSLMNLASTRLVEILEHRGKTVEHVAPAGRSLVECETE